MQNLDYGYSAHRRVVGAVSGLTIKGGKAYVAQSDKGITILENRVNGQLRSVTVLDSTGKAVSRLSGETARY